jgi:hypothetical protein
MAEKKYYLTDQYNEWASEIILEKRKDILDAGISVGFISSTKEKKHGRIKSVLAECKKVQELEKLYCPHDFLIIIYEMNCEGMTDEQMKILIWHELEHIGIDAETGEFFVKPHDVEEFDKIIDAHGLHWEEVCPHG